MRSLDDIHDEWLVLRCQDGDAAALAELVDRWQPRLIRHALRLTGKPDDAADVAQAAWVAIIHGLRRLDDPACFRRWAYQITTYKCADWIRKRQQERARVVSLVNESVDQTAPEEDSQDEITALREAIKQLPHERREILAMFYVEDMSLAEIAHALSLPVGTVKSRLYYARLELKETIERRNS